MREDDKNGRKRIDRDECSELDDDDDDDNDDVG